MKLNNLLFIEPGDTSIVEEFAIANGLPIDDRSELQE